MDATCLDGVVKRASSVVNLELNPLEVVLESRTLNKVLSIMANPNHPLHSAFAKQKSVFSFPLQSCTTDRRRKPFVPRAVHSAF